MTAKEYLEQIKLLDIEIRQRREERDALRDAARCDSSPTLTADKVQTSGAQSRMEDTVVRYTDIEAEINAKLLDLAILRHRIIGQIHQLGKAKYVELLQLKYVGQRGKDGRIHYLRLEEIACVMKKSNGMPYSYEHIRALHGEALKKFSEIMY